MLPTALPLLTGLLLLSTPDILPDGMRGIRVDSRLDAKALAAEHCLGYVLQKGDTLLGIARTYLGDQARWPEIEKLNPLLEADKLRPGELVWLPPQDAAAAKKEPVFAYLDTGRPVHRAVAPLVDGATIEPSRYGGIGVYLVPESARAAFREALGTPDSVRGTKIVRPVADLVAAGKVREIDGRAPSRLVPTNDPTSRRVDTHLVEKGADGKFVLRVTSVAYDKQGNVLDGQKRDSKQQALLLLLLAATGGGILLRRARAPRQALPALA